MERSNTLFSGLFGFNIALFTYFLFTESVDVTLHSMIFASGVLTILLFTLSKTVFEGKVQFLATAVLLATTFVSSTIVPFGSNVFRWLIVVIYNIAQTRTMTLVDIQKVAKRNAIMNTLMLLLNVAYEVIK